MDDFKKTLIALLIRSFLPIMPFYFNYLNEMKQFTNHEISNHIAPFYYYSSFLGVISCKTIVQLIGIPLSSLVVAALYFSNMLLLLNLPIRNFPLSKLVYCISGFASSFDNVLRFYIAETSDKPIGVDSRYSWLVAMRAISTAFACFVGQEIVLKTGHYELNIIITLSSQFVSLILTIITTQCIKKSPVQLEFNFFSALKPMDSTILRAFLIGVIANGFYSFIRFFFNTIFRDTSDKKQAEEENSQADVDANTAVPGTNNIRGSRIKRQLLRFLKDFKRQLKEVLYFPIKITATVLINTICLIFPKYSKPRKCEEKYLTGNEDAAVNLFCFIVSLGIVKSSNDNSREFLFISLLLAASLSLLLMTKIRVKTVSFLLYLAIGISSNSSNQLSKLTLKNAVYEKDLIVLSLICENIIHSSINQICRFLKVDSIVKTTLFAGIGILTSFIVILLKLVEIKQS